MKQLIGDISQWSKGVRLYIAIATLLITAEVYWWVHSVYVNSSTASIRMQEIFAWTSLGLLLFTLAIGPALKLFPKLPGKGLLRDARRMLGVSAAWFAAWHVGISYKEQFDLANPLHLPGIYQRAFALGIVSLIILILLAATSFDGAFRKLGIWWFRLHRLIYLSVLLVLFHAFMIGVHATNWPILIALTVVVALLFAAHMLLSFGPGKEPTILRSIVLCYGLLVTVGVFAYGYSQHLGYQEPNTAQSGGAYESR